MSELMRFECPQCGKSLSAKPQFAGRSTRCPKCQCLVQVPAPAVETDDILQYLQETEPAAVPPPPKPQEIPEEQLKLAAEADEMDDARPVSRGTAFSMPAEPIETPSPAVPNGHSPSVSNAGFEDPHPDASPPPPRTAIPPVRPSIPLPPKYPPIPAHYTPDSFRNLRKRFELLLIILCVGRLVRLVLRILAVNLIPYSDSASTLWDLFLTFMQVTGVLIILSGIVAIVFQFILLYRFWWLIQDGTARTTPEKALWLMGVPLFNFYWWYVVIVGLAEDMNRYCDEKRIQAPRISMGQALALFVTPWYAGAYQYVLVAFLSIMNPKNWIVVGFLNVIPGFVVPILLILLFKQYVDVSIAILETRRGRAVV